MKKYTVFADYVATKIVGEVVADNKEEAVDKLKDKVEMNLSLCMDCEENFIDGLRIPDGGIYAES